jgi:hypothetical protein
MRRRQGRTPIPADLLVSSWRTSRALRVLPWRLCERPRARWPGRRPQCGARALVSYSKAHARRRRNGGRSVPGAARCSTLRRCRGGSERCVVITISDKFLSLESDRSTAKEEALPDGSPRSERLLRCNWGARRAGSARYHPAQGSTGDGLEHCRSLLTCLWFGGRVLHGQRSRLSRR